MFSILLNGPQFIYCTEDSGFSCNSRKRLWHIAVAKQWGTFCRNPQEVYDKLTAALQHITLDASDLFFIDDPVLMEEDMKSVKKSKRKEDSL